MLGGCAAERIEEIKCTATCEDCSGLEFECTITVEDDIDIVRKDLTNNLSSPAPQASYKQTDEKPPHSENTVFPIPDNDQASSE